MSSLVQVVQYLYAFVTVVGFNCARPVNWENCRNPQDWLLPQLAELYYQWQNPYEKEKLYHEK